MDIALKVTYGISGLCGAKAPSSFQWWEESTQPLVRSSPPPPPPPPPLLHAAWRRRMETLAGSWLSAVSMCDVWYTPPAAVQTHVYKDFTSWKGVMRTCSTVCVRMFALVCVCVCVCGPTFYFIKKDVTHQGHQDCYKMNIEPPREPPNNNLGAHHHHQPQTNICHRVDDTEATQRAVHY